MSDFDGPSAPGGAPSVLALGRAMKTQCTSNDARTERLVREVRSEIDSLRRSLYEFSFARETLVDVNLEAVAADPESAAGLPPPLLVRALVTAHASQEKLRTEVDRTGDRLHTIEGELHDLLLERARLEVRVETFEDVIGALHANLEDLRIERDHRLGRPEPGGQLPTVEVGLPPSLEDGSQRGSGEAA